MNYANVLTVTHAAIDNGATDDAAAKVAFDAIKAGKGTIADILKEERKGTAAKRSVSAVYRGQCAAMRVVLIADGIDVTDRKAVHAAIKADVWADHGYATPLVQSRNVPLIGQEHKDYTDITQRNSRLAKDIVGETKPAPQVVATPIPRALRATLKADTLDAGVDYKVALATLKAIYGK